MRPLALLALVACSDPAQDGDLTRNFEDIVRKRAGVEFPCAEESVRVTDLGGWAYRASGCGVHATYECEYSDAKGANRNAWLYICKRAVTDVPEPDDGGGG
jgi:hypothetical protein